MQTQRFATLDKEYTALIFQAADLIDARDAGDVTAVARLEAVRIRRDALKAELRRQDTNYDRNEY